MLSSRKKLKKEPVVKWEKDQSQGKYWKKSTFNNLEDVLSQWFNESRASNILISGAILQEKACQIAERMETEDFQASNRWLENFKKRHDLVSKRICGESNSVSTVSYTHLDVYKRQE